jgi:transposase InsO family protein
MDPTVKTAEPEPRQVNVVQGEDWRAPIMAYHRHHYEPDSNTELTRMQQRAKAYQIVRDELYKTSVTWPLLRCLSKDKGKELLTQTHLGVCGGHIGARALTAKVFRQGFYWPSVIDDASKLVTTCQACQKFSPNTQAPSKPSQLITLSWPLQRWCIDIVGPLAIAQGNYKYTVVVVEYFTKWIEAKPLVNIAATRLKRFFWQNIICHFGVPKEITVDNAKQFNCHIFKDFGR